MSTRDAIRNTWRTRHSSCARPSRPRRRA